MARYKIYRKNEYVFLDDLQLNKSFRYLVGQIYFQKSNGEIEQFFTQTPDGFREFFNFSDVTDEAGTVYDAVTWENFYTKLKPSILATSIIDDSIPINVNVTNQLDLTTITGYLLDIKNSASNIETNTDAVETKIDSIVTAINANGTVNHSDLLDVIAELQAVNANTDNLELVANDILAKIIASPATLAEQQTQTAVLETLLTDEELRATPVPIELASNLSAFGDLNTAELTPLVQIDFIYGILTHFGTTSISATGTADVNNSRLRLQTGVNTLGSATYTSVKIAKYRPAQGVDARFTVAFSDSSTAVEEYGMGDGANGYFFTKINGALSILHRNNSIDTLIPFASWNGTPPVGYNNTLGNAYKILYPYQGYANIKFYIFNGNTGKYDLVHTIKYANTSKEVQVRNPNFSFRGYISNNGTGVNATSYIGSIGVFLSGKRTYLGLTGFAQNNKAVNANQFVNLLTIKNATNFNGVQNKSLIRIQAVAFCIGNLGNNQFGYLQLRKNATIAGTNTYVPDNGATLDNGATITSGQSPVSVNKTGTTVTGGEFVWGTNGTSDSNAFVDVKEFDIFVAPGETFTFVGNPTANSSLSVVVNYVNDI